MDFELENIMDWFDENKDWFLIPTIVTVAIVLIGFVLMLLTGKDVNFVLKFIFILLLFSSPVLGFFLGDFLDPYLEPLFSKISK